MSPSLRLLTAVAVALALPLAACDSGDGGSPAADALAATPDVAGSDAGPTEDVAPDVAEAPATLGSCLYINLFSGGSECKEYTGAGWSDDAARSDCATVFAGESPTYPAGERCGFAAQLGACKVDGDDGFVLVSSGAYESGCGPAQAACETFLSGTFTPDPVCDGGGPTIGLTGEPFVQPAQTCVEPLEGEPAGESAGGDVCTWNIISGCTEPGRRYADYGSCEPVFTQRPYYGFGKVEEPDPQDPRLQDDALLLETAWVREQVEACACVCCHSADLPPDGPSGWTIDAGALWTDTIPDTGVAMLAGLADSVALGAYAPEQNNGFDRETTGLPTTDIGRMRAFFEAEWERRGYALEEAAEVAAFGGPLVTQLSYEPEPCQAGQGVRSDGTVEWTGGAARYVYVLEAGSANPGVPPNLDLPEGTVWRLDVAADAEAVASGVSYGEVPEGAAQRYPAEGAPLSLQDGTVYYLYVLADVAVPLARCLFSYESK